MIHRPSTSLRLGSALALACALFALAGAASAAEGPTRSDYVAALEAICAPQADRTERAVKGVRGDIAAERFGPAARKFAAAERIFGATVREIGAVSRPVADRPKLSEWFGYLERQRGYLGKIAASFRADEPIRAQRLTARFVHNGNLANNVVLAFGFRECAFKFSRFR